LYLRNFVIFYIIFPDLAIGLFSYVDSVGPVFCINILREDSEQKECPKTHLCQTCILSREKVKFFFYKDFYWQTFDVIHKIYQIVIHNISILIHYYIH